MVSETPTGAVEGEIFDIEHDDLHFDTDLADELAIHSDEIESTRTTRQVTSKLIYDLEGNQNQ